MLDAALRPAARVPDRGRARVDAGAAAAVLGLVELAVDDALEHDEDDAEEHREERDADVGLEVPLLPHRTHSQEDDHRVLLNWILALQQRHRQSNFIGRQHAEQTRLIGSWKLA